MTHTRTQKRARDVNDVGFLEKDLASCMCARGCMRVYMYGRAAEFGGSAGERTEERDLYTRYTPTRPRRHAIF